MLMKRPKSTTAALLLMTPTLCACFQQGDAGAKNDKADPGESASTRSMQEMAVIAATPQVSMSTKERQEIREVARGYLDDVAIDLAKGFSPVIGMEDVVVSMQPTDVHAWSLSLRQKVNYRIIAECDNECSDLDMELIDPSGKIVERDTLPDSAPVINIQPPANGIYTARLIMRTCTVAPCYAAGRLYEQSKIVPDDI